MGHLFVALGDLTKLACDAVLVPCDGEGWVTAPWRSLLPPGLRRDPGTGWFRLPEPPVNGVVRLPDADNREVWAFATMEWVADDPEDVVGRIWHAITTVSPSARASGGRAVPLIGLPLAGTGEGGLADRRGEVIDELLAKHRREGGTLPCDVALILFERRDFAAVQARRHSEDWPEEVLSKNARPGRSSRRTGPNRSTVTLLGVGYLAPRGSAGLEWTPGPARPRCGH